MNEQEALAKMKFPRNFRGPRKIFQIWVTRACDKKCFGCTQNSQLRGKPGMITPEQYREAVLSMVTGPRKYPGVIAMFGGNPCIHPQFDELCEIARELIPYKQRGIWTNNLMGKGRIARRTFNPHASNFNVHMDLEAAKEFERDWPQTRGMIKGKDHPSSHSPIWTALLDMETLPFPDGPRENTEENRWELISGCDINQRWSAMIGVFRGQLRGWFCEIAGSMSMWQEADPDYPDTGLPVVPGWWDRPEADFHDQVRHHCHRCGVPLRGKGALDKDGPKEQVSPLYQLSFQPKDDRPVEIATTLEQIERVPHVTDYMANYKYQPKAEQ